MNTNKLNRQLMAHDIAPNWLLALRRHKAPEHARLSIDRADHCIVGEAFGFDGKYEYCPICYRFSLEFAYCVHGSNLSNRKYDEGDRTRRSYFYIVDLKEYRTTFAEFLEHFNQEHKNWWYDNNVNH